MKLIFIIFFLAPPKWTKEPQDASVGLEGRISLDCERPSGAKDNVVQICR